MPITIHVLSHHSLFLQFSFLLRAAGDSLLFQEKACSESAPFPAQRCLESDAAGPRLSLGRAAKAELSPPWQLWPEESPVESPRVPDTCRIFPQQMWGAAWGVDRSPQGCPAAMGGTHCWCLILHGNHTPLLLLAMDTPFPSESAKPLSHPFQHRFPVLHSQIPCPV